MTENSSAYTLKLPAEEWREVKVAASEEGISIRAWVREAMRAKLGGRVPIATGVDPPHQWKARTLGASTRHPGGAYSADPDTLRVTQGEDMASWPAGSPDRPPPPANAHAPGCQCLFHRLGGTG